MSSVAVIDYGMGNLHSIAKALQHAAPQVDVQIVSDPELILKADRVVFPGVGAMRDCMQALNETHLAEVIKEVAKSKPLLGICLGMQALLTDSEENGSTQGLNILPGHVMRFSDSLVDAQGNNLKIPHMGWNRVAFREGREDHPVFAGIPAEAEFYFVHSYYPAPADAAWAAGWTDYGIRFCSAVARGNLVAVQFHLEKSGRPGLTLLANFCRWGGNDAQ